MVRQPTPLPEKLPERLQNSETINSAYSMILNFEKDAATRADDKIRLMCVRILGYLLREGPSDEARMNIASEIVSCKTRDAVMANGMFYFENFLRPFKKYRGRSPATSSHSSRPSLDTIKDMTSQYVKEPVQNYASSKKHALARDSYRCVLTGHFDIRSVHSNKELWTIANSLPDARTTETNCAHIFHEGTDMDVTEKEGESWTDKGKAKMRDERSYAASVWAVMDRFGYKNLLSDLSGNNVHRLENILTLSTVAHGKFDTLHLWLEAVENQQNTYRIRGSADIHIREYNPTVTFTTPDPINLPLPSETYLAIHAACCRVANLSGAAEYMDEIEREWEDTGVLSMDGSSAELLNYVLAPLSYQSEVK